MTAGGWACGLRGDMITSASNNRIKKVAALNRKAKERRQEEKYVVEGIRMFLEAPQEEMLELYLSESFLGLLEPAGSADLAGSGETVEKDEPAGDGEQMQRLQECRRKLEKLCRGGMVVPETVSDDVFRKMSDTSSPQGILCVMRMKRYEPRQLLAGEKPFLMILEDIQDPGNLGTILRTGEGAGINGVILSRDCADLFNPKTIRSTMGSIYRVPFLYVSSLAEAIDWLRQKKVSVYAAHLQGKRWYDEENYTTGCAFLIGNEGNGLRPETAALADTYIKIPMEGKVESLNAAMASGILMYEAARQRRKNASS